ncbi:hypothetical protein ACVWWN_006557 [Mycobacterium sp. URHB0021]
MLTYRDVWCAWIRWSEDLNAIAHMIVNDGTVLAPPSSGSSKSSTPTRASEFAVVL